MESSAIFSTNVPNSGSKKKGKMWDTAATIFKDLIIYLKVACTYLQFEIANVSPLEKRGLKTQGPNIRYCCDEQMSIL